MKHIGHASPYVTTLVFNLHGDIYSEKDRYQTVNFPQNEPYFWHKRMLMNTMISSLSPRHVTQTYRTSALLSCFLCALPTGPVEPFLLFHHSEQRSRLDGLMVTSSDLQLWQQHLLKAPQRAMHSPYRTKLKNE